MLYFTVLLSILAGFAFVVDRPWEFYQLVAIAVLFLVPGRIVQFFWKDYFEGKKRLALQDYDGAVASFETFLAQIREKRWLRWLTFFSYGVYSFKIEAVVLTHMAEASLHRKQFDAAREFLHQAVQTDTRYCFAYYYLAVLELLSGNRRDAERNFQQARQHGYPRLHFDDFVERTHDHFLPDSSRT